MEVSARLAVAADAPEIARLLADAVIALDGQRGAAQWLATEAPAAPDAAELAAGSPLVWLLGCIDDVPVGVAAAGEVRWRDGRVVVRAEVVYVDPGAREVGVGEALVDELLALAGRRGAVALESTALPGDRELKNLFERVGLVARAIVVSKALTAS